jgi:transglutaminase-like putative cysteine protease
LSSSAPSLTVAPRFKRSTPADSRELSDTARGVIRLVTFAALALYGVMRWGTLLNPSPTWRLLGLFALAVLVAGALPVLRRYGPVPGAYLTGAACLIALPLAGLRWHSFVHVRVAVASRFIGDGLVGLPNAAVPYTGPGHAVRTVIVLGAAVLLLDAAVLLAYAPSGSGDARRAGTALPLIALAVVPSTLVRPQLPYLQGLVLFALIAAFMWGERLRREAIRTALTVAAVAGILGAVVAPRLDTHKPLLDYRAWAGSIANGPLDTFSWNQTYGPLHWPHSGHEVFTVDARTGDYWKAEDLNLFNGYAWVLGVSTAEPALPAPRAWALRRWTQTIRVTIHGMTTNDVIAAGYAGQPTALAGGVENGVDPGTWVAGRALGPGSSYEIATYSPHPSAEQLAQAGDAYPLRALTNDLQLTVPQTGSPPQSFTQVTFNPFHTIRSIDPSVYGGPTVTRFMDHTPYGPAYALAQQLAARSATPYAFVHNVLDFLARGGYTYNQNPPVSTFPLLNFLFKDKRGYCQQFSGAMAMLLRMGGVPARVATGFATGTRTAANEWTVSDIDAHAWVEAWFPRYGWVRFDPTPSVAPARAGQSSAAITKQLPTGNTGASGAAPGASTPTPTTRGGTHTASGGGPNALLIVAGIAAVALLAAIVWRVARRGMGQDDLLAELERAMVRTGRPLAGGVTLAVLEHRFRDSPGAVEYLRSLRLRRYGGGGTPPTSRGRRALRAELRFGLGPSGRLRALWALPPRSLAHHHRHAGQ